MHGASKITPAAALRCTVHTLAEQLAMHREIERRRIIDESCERIMTDADELGKTRISVKFINQQVTGED